MFEFLSAYLENAVTPERRVVFLNACQTLVDNEVIEHAFVIDQQLAMIDNLDNDTVLGGISEYLLTKYRDLLGEFGIAVDDDITLAQITDLFTALMCVEHYENRESIQTCCDDAEGPEEALADILQLTGASHATDYLQWLESVAPELIEKIAENTRFESVDELPPLAMVEICRERITKLQADPQAQKYPDLRLLSLLEDGTRLGLGRETYIGNQRAYLETQVPERLAVELLAMILASTQSQDSVLTVLSEELGLLHMDQFKITAAHVAATKLYRRIGESSPVDSGDTGDA